MKSLEHDPDRELFDSDPAAKYIGASLSWLTKERSHGRGPRFLKIGGRVKYRRSDLDEYLNSRVRETTDSRKAKAA